MSIEAAFRTSRQSLAFTNPILLLVLYPRHTNRPPSDIEHFAKGIKVVEKDVCISEEGGAIPHDPRLDTCRLAE